MNNKILLGSIISVVILILVSFTSVIGYRSIESDVKVSPLFNIRSSKAIGKESKDFTCDYVGKGEETNIQFSSRIERTEQVQKVLEIISNTDDKTFIAYLNLIINQMQKNDKYNDVNINEVITAIHQLRDNPDRVNLDENKNNDITWRYEFVPTLCWFPGCNFIILIEEIIWGIVVRILAWITSGTCYPHTTGCCP